MRSRSPSASRSNATNAAGVSAASRLTRDAAGWMRWPSTSKSRRPSTATTTSPSTTQRCGSERLSGSSSSGKYLVKGRSLRLPSSTSSPSRNTMQRNPSHLGSKTKSPAGTAWVALANIGSTGGMTGKRTSSTYRTPTTAAQDQLASARMHPDHRHCGAAGQIGHDTLALADHQPYRSRTYTLPGGRQGGR